ncbi:hypothetical protein L596_003775 [Steinernema carpocapsae]|uniref:Uncharacterized protein n=1 Tax=Steinernema carpocapsae TaxID=34508 RepID=A0A4U8UVB3_STECR|nr:hypothetical protein L596_003775 [Steinernema carpocapsae]
MKIRNQQLGSGSFWVRLNFHLSAASMWSYDGVLNRKRIVMRYAAAGQKRPTEDAATVFPPLEETRNTPASYRQPR